MSSYYDTWITEQAARIEAAVRLTARTGQTNISAWVIPSQAGIPGTLHIGTEPPFFGADVVRLGPHGSRLCACPYSHIRSLLWHAGRSFPVLPIESEKV